MTQVLLDDFEYQLTACHPAGSRYIRMMRQQLNGGIKQAFRQQAYELCGRSRRGMRRMQLHHILPLSLGGTNQKNNLVLVAPKLHEVIHDFIDAQLMEMPVRGKMRVYIPWRKGMVWG